MTAVAGAAGRSTEAMAGLGGARPTSSISFASYLRISSRLPEGCWNPHGFSWRQRANSHIRTALDSPQPSRSASMRAISLDTGMPSCAAAAFSASQNGASREMEVRWPPMVKERLSGPSRLRAARVALSGSAFGSLHGEWPLVRSPPPQSWRSGPRSSRRAPSSRRRLQPALGRGLGPLALGDAEARPLLVGAALALGLLLLLAVAVEVDDVSHHASGPIIFLGSTSLSNSSAET